jgi:pyrroline-5-carboxylate reductase
MADKALAFLGAGNMAEAIARGLVSAGVLEADRMLACDVAEDRRSHLQQALGIEATADAAEAVDRAPTVLVAVKPQQFDEALEPVADRFGPEKLVLTICAGVATTHAEEVLAAGTRVVRAMPNTPMLVGRGMAAICKGAAATDDDLAEAERLLGAAADVLAVSEDLMDAVTAVSGSGPAYFFYLAELLAEAGVAVGLAEDDARRLARVTFEGAARLMAETGEAPAALREKVTSPGGTTEAALAMMDAMGLKKTVTEAVRAARDRGRELGR